MRRYPLFKPKITPVDIESRRYTQLRPEEAFRRDLDRILYGINRVALTLGFGRLSALYTFTATTTPQLMREHFGQDDRLLLIHNDDTIGAADLRISNEANIANYIVIKAGESFKLLITFNDKIYARASAGSFTVRIAEFTMQPL